MCMLSTLKTKLFGSIPLFPTTVRQRQYLRALPEIPEDRGKRPTVSLVIPTRNRPESLKRCLESVARQTIRPNEIIVVNNGRIDVQDILSRYTDTGILIRQVKENIAGISRARNVGAKNTSSELIFFVDDDVILAPNYIEELMRVFLSDPEKKIGGADGHFNRYEPKGFKKMFWPVFAFYSSNFDGAMLASGFFQKVNTPDHPVTTQIVYGVAGWRKEVFAGDLFDEINFPGYSIGEDAEFAYRVSKKFTLVHTPFARFEHRPASNGHPHPFKIGMQKPFSTYKTLALNDEIGLANLLLMDWFFIGEQLRIFYSLLDNSGVRKKMSMRLMGQGVGTLTCSFWARASNGRTARLINQWLSQVGE